MHVLELVRNRVVDRGIRAILVRVDLLIRTDQPAHHGGINVLTKEGNVTVHEQDVGAGPVETEDLVIGSTVRRGSPYAGRRPAEGTDVVVNNSGAPVIKPGIASNNRAVGVRGRRRIAGNAIAVVRFRPAPERPLVPRDGVGVGAWHGFVATYVLCDGNRLAQTVLDVFQLRALTVDRPVQRAVHAGVPVANTGDRIDVRVDRRAVVRVAVPGTIKAAGRAERVIRTLEDAQANSSCSTKASRRVKTDWVVKGARPVPRPPGVAAV